MPIRNKVDSKDGSDYLLVERLVPCFGPLVPLWIKTNIKWISINS